MWLVWLMLTVSQALVTTVAHFDSGPDNTRILADKQATASARRSPVWRMEEGGGTGHGGNGTALLPSSPFANTLISLPEISEMANDNLIDHYCSSSAVSPTPRCTPTPIKSG